MNIKLKLPIGLSDFRQVIQEKYYFVDKSLLIQEILEDSASVLLITRPRRFGKTLNISMLRYFFAKEVDDQTTQGLFDGLKIQQTDESIRQHQGKYPVIFLTFKDFKYSAYQEAYQQFCTLIAEVYTEHIYLLEETLLSENEKAKYHVILSEKANSTDLGNSLRKLSQYLHRYHRVSPIILIDEYDTPIQTGYLNGYYPQIVELFRHFFGAGLKDNPHCFKAVLTGILRVSKESLFSGLNNLRVYSMLNERYGQYFGFTEAEVQVLLQRLGLQNQADGIREWYNGYQIGKHTVYNPWSLLNCLVEHGALNRYWLNTSDNALVKECLYHSGLIYQEILERLLNNQSVTCVINESVVFPDLKNLGLKQQEVILSFLLMAGYFKIISSEYTERGQPKCQLAIPNREIKGLYAELIEYWLLEGQQLISFDEFIGALLRGDIATFETSFRTLLENTISVHDLAKEPEAFYHGFMIGLTAHIQFNSAYELKSNRESGYGRYDYLIVSRTPDKPSLLMEFKRVDLPKKSSVKQIESALIQAAQSGLTQIELQRYQSALSSGTQLIKIALAFYGKRFKLMHQTEFVKK
jgi:Predicted AAA-ATPase/PD-(D/E)XK nuclease superfamily